MISCACVFRSIGKVSANSSGSRSHPHTICGVSEEVAQVSITSGSATKPPGRRADPRCSRRGTSLLGSIGSRSSAGTIGCAWSGSPSASSGYQTGNGTPKNRCREISQSPLRPFTQLS